MNCMRMVCYMIFWIYKCGRIVKLLYVVYDKYDFLWFLIWVMFFFCFVSFRRFVGKMWMDLKIVKFEVGFWL